MPGTRQNSMLILALMAGFISCGSSDDPNSMDRKSRRNKPEAREVSGLPLSSRADRFVVHDTSWAQPDVESSNEPEEPPIEVSWEEGQRQKFNREGSKRWKNTEIYIRGRR